MIMRTQTSDVKGYISIIVLFVYFITIIDCHPQCLDFRAPFRPDKNLSFCTDYSEFGCCGSQDDNKIKKEYEFIRSRVTREDWNGCQSYVHGILCQKCSPFAAHIYDAEGTSKARKFPGLCTGYCNDFYDNCKDLVWLLDQSLAATSVLAEKDRFCQQVAITDALYCYPDLLTRPLILRNLSIDQNIGATPGCLCLETLKDNLANPLWARHAGDGSRRLFVAEQKGRVRIYNTKTKKWNKNCFLDFTSKAEVSNFPGDERGFLGMAFHPKYPSNGRIFVYYSTSMKPKAVLPPELRVRPFTFKSKIVISEVKVSDSDPNRADPNFERTLLEVPQPYENHNGGELMFGMDGYLYAFIGDGGGAGDPMEAGQNKSLLHGKVIRIDVDSDPSKPYTIPPDNPFVGEAGSRPEIFAYGIRNIWRCGLDKKEGHIVCGDVGQNAYEEVDIIKKGANYGWNSKEGFECYNDLLCGRIGPEELPLHAYDHRIGQSVTGGVFYRGCENPALVGQYIYGDFSSSRLFSLTKSDGGWTNSDVHLCGSSLCQGGLVGSSSDYILSFGEDEDGEIYMLTSKSSSSKDCDGKLYKIIDPARRNDPSTCSSDHTHRKRVPLTHKDQSNAAVATITIRIRTRKGTVSGTTASQSWKTDTFGIYSVNSSLTPHTRQRQYINSENQRNRRTLFSQTSSPSPLRNQNTDYLESIEKYLTTPGVERHAGTSFPPIRASKKTSSSPQRSSSRKRTSQDLNQQNPTAQAPRRQRKRGKKKSNKRANRRKSSTVKENTCGSCWN